MSNPRNVLFVTNQVKSLGESYTAFQMARDLEQWGWSTTFLAFEFAASFLREAGLQVFELRDDRAHNQAALRSAARCKPRMMVTADYYLFRSSNAARYWDFHWLDGLDCPVASLDHLGFHPEACAVEIGYARVVSAHAGTPRQLLIEALPSFVDTVLRPCPLHSPALSASEKTRVFRWPTGDAPSPETVDGVRAQLGLGEDEKLVVLSVGSWALQAATELRIPYREVVVQLAARALSHLGIPVRLVFLCGEEQERIESAGQLTVQYLGRVPFDLAQSLLLAADLVLSDNVTSSMVSRAVLREVPAAVLVNSVDASTTADGTLAIKAPFAISDAAYEGIRRMETEAPGSVFPSWVYPMGWQGALEPLFRENPYRATTDWLDLFDEAGTREGLGRLLCDSDYRTLMRGRQRAYADVVRKVPLPREVLSDLVGQ
jgi:hypothetical protein